ncbi:hypothetical protein E2320_012145, partial [Naja naja]
MIDNFDTIWAVKERKRQVLQPSLKALEEAQRSQAKELKFQTPKFRRSTNEDLWKTSVAW